jgi:hypothetical protein
MKMEAEVENLFALSPLLRIKSALAILWQFFGGELPYEDTLEEEKFDAALAWTAAEYIKTYDIDVEQLRWDRPSEKGVLYSGMEVLANELTKRKDFEDLSEEEKEHIGLWIEMLHKKYSTYF